MWQPLQFNGMIQGYMKNIDARFGIIKEQPQRSHNNSPIYGWGRHLQILVALLNPRLRQVVSEPPLCQLSKPTPSAVVRILPTAMNHRGRGKGYAAAAEVKWEDTRICGEYRCPIYGWAQHPSQFGTIEEQRQAITWEFTNLWVRTAPSNPRGWWFRRKWLNPFHWKTSEIIIIDARDQKIEKMILTQK